MLGRVQYNQVQQNHLFGIGNNTQVQQQQQGFNGITPEFFGPAGPQDRAKDMRLCRELGIDMNGMDRTDVKANILSKLTGQPVDQMKAFYTGMGENDRIMDYQKMNTMGINPSQNPDQMMARAENKASIVNAWVQQNNGQQSVTDQTQQADQGKKAQGGKGGGGGGQPQISQALLSILNSLGLSPSGSKESDYTQVMNHLDSLDAKADGDISQKQYISQMRQTFLAVYASL